MVSANASPVSGLTVQSVSRGREEGTPIEYEVRYSKRRKTIGITVERDRSVVVTAPEGTSAELIARAVEGKRGWVLSKVRHEQKLSPLPHPPGKELVSGESLLYLGREYPIEIVDNDRYAIQFDNRFLIPRARAASRYSVFREWLKARAEEYIFPRVRERAQKLGVSVSGLKITDGRHRWGSCTPKGSLNFNWRLIKAPPFVIDYVIVHELAHLIEPNHTPAFWNIIEAQIPQVAQAKAWLRNHGELLAEEL
jgi:predicted metal-dependent hydrolase